MAGHADVPYFAYAFFDKPFWEDPMQWFKQSSLSYVGNVTTPTMLMTGVLDMRTPMSQTEALLLGAQGSRGSSQAAPVRERVARDRFGAVELDADDAVHDELVQGAHAAHFLTSRRPGAIASRRQRR